MTISVNHLFNRLVTCFKKGSASSEHSVFNFAEDPSWATERRLIHENSYVLDSLAAKIARHGDKEAQNAFTELMRGLTLRMLDHPYMRKRPGIVMGFVIRMMHTDGLVVASLRGAETGLAAELAALIGVDADNVRISPQLVPAETAKNMSPHQMYNTVSQALHDLRNPDGMGIFRERNRAASIPPIQEQSVVLRDFVLFAHVHLPAGAPTWSQVMRNASARLPYSLRPLSLPVQTPGGAGSATVGITFFRAGTGYSALTTVLYSSAMLRVLMACFAVVQGPRPALNVVGVSGQEMGRVLAAIRVHCQFIDSRDSMLSTMRLTLMRRDSDEVLGGVSVEGVSDPHSMLSKLVSYFESRISFSRQLANDPYQEGDEGAVRFYTPNRQSWDITEMAVSISI